MHLDDNLGVDDGGIHIIGGSLNLDLRAHTRALVAQICEGYSNTPPPRQARPHHSSCDEINPSQVERRTRDANHKRRGHLGPGIDAVAAADVDELPDGFTQGSSIHEVVIEHARGSGVSQQVRMSLGQVGARERPVIQSRPYTQLWATILVTIRHHTTLFSRILSTRIGNGMSRCSLAESGFADCMRFDFEASTLCKRLVTGCLCGTHAVVRPETDNTL